MTMLLSVLAVALTGSSSVAGLAHKAAEPPKIIRSSTTSKSAPLTQDDVELINFSRDLSTAIDKLPAELAINEDSVKAIIENSIAYSAIGTINFDLEKLSALQETNFYQLISANEKIASLTLTKLIEEGLLEYNTGSQLLHFQEPKTLATYNSHVWAVHQWSWFLYWELHFDSEITQTIAFLAAVGASMIDELGPIDGFWGVGIEAIGNACQALSDEFSDKDNGNGVCLRWDAMVPRDLVSR